MDEQVTFVKDKRTLIQFLGLQAILQDMVNYLQLYELQLTNLEESQSDTSKIQQNHELEDKVKDFLAFLKAPPGSNISRRYSCSLRKDSVLIPPSQCKQIKEELKSIITVLYDILQEFSKTPLEFEMTCVLHLLSHYPGHKIHPINSKTSSTVEEESDTNEKMLILTEKLSMLNAQWEQESNFNKTGENYRGFAREWLQSKLEYTRNNNMNIISDKGKEIEWINEKVMRDFTAYENLQAWTTLVGAQKQRNIDEWNKKSEKDVSALDRQIEKLEAEIQAQREKIKELETTIQTQVDELAPWEEEREKDLHERLLQLRRYHCARKIQRWWRVIMVEFGLYKKKAKPVKTKKKRKQSGSQGGRRSASLFFL